MSSQIHGDLPAGGAALGIGGRVSMVGVLRWRRASGNGGAPADLFAHRIAPASEAVASIAITHTHRGLPVNIIHSTELSSKLQSIGTIGQQYAPVDVEEQDSRQGKKRQMGRCEAPGVFW